MVFSGKGRRTSFITRQESTKPFSMWLTVKACKFWLLTVKFSRVYSLKWRPSPTSASSNKPLPWFPFYGCSPVWTRNKETVSPNSQRQSFWPHCLFPCSFFEEMLWVGQDLLYPNAKNRFQLSFKQSEERRGNGNPAGEVWQWVIWQEGTSMLWSLYYTAGFYHCYSGIYNGWSWFFLSLLVCVLLATEICFAYLWGRLYLDFRAGMLMT